MFEEAQERKSEPMSEVMLRPGEILRQLWTDTPPMEPTILEPVEPNDDEIEEIIVGDIPATERPYIKPQRPQSTTSATNVDANPPAPSQLSGKTEIPVVHVRNQKRPTPAPAPARSGKPGDANPRKGHQPGLRPEATPWTSCAPQRCSPQHIPQQRRPMSARRRRPQPRPTNSDMFYDQWGNPILVPRARPATQAAPCRGYDYIPYTCNPLSYNQPYMYSPFLSHLVDGPW
ncbi:Uncharacterized protein PBTT_01251 [Plasmodiophora brassicae]|uniref:Uncharacterized protein n=1 Tax=Plasmodiophora brassicae TaxID=37360 RepID=A0A0G4IYQ4_PLABS|nr:hypothetical protein PBRA_001547 [Plasmodiophora brassicae]SPQ94007.1 unnamed protein product [Plasmodiophora brassicae]